MHAVRRVRPRQAPLQELEPVHQHADDADDGARAVVRHLLLRRRQPALRARRARARLLDEMQDWAKKFGFGADGRPRHRRRGAAASLPTPAWRKRDRARRHGTRPWNPGDPIQLAIGQKDMTVTPLQMARFYALIANGGKLVTPYVVSAVEQPGERRHAAGAAEARSRRRRRVPIDVDPRSAQRRPRRPLPGDPRRRGHLLRRLRQLPRPDRRQDRARPRRSSTCPATRSGISRTRRGGAAGGRSTATCT